MSPMSPDDPRRSLWRTVRSGYAGVTATLALLVALGGVGWAATALPRGSVGAVQLRTGAVTSVDVKDRSLRARDFARGQLPRGARGPRGPAGPLLSVLPAGRSLTGTWSLGQARVSAADLAITSISFPLALPEGVAAQIVPADAEPTAACPGTAANPRSAPGRMCVYVGYREGPLPDLGIFNPLDGEGAVTSRFGVVVFALPGNDSFYDVNGTWSVTP